MTNKNKSGEHHFLNQQQQQQQQTKKPKCHGMTDPPGHSTAPEVRRHLPQGPEGEDPADVSPSSWFQEGNMVDSDAEPENTALWFMMPNSKSDNIKR